MDGPSHRAITKSRRSGYDPIADVRSIPLLVTALRPIEVVPRAERLLYGWKKDIADLRLARTLNCSAYARKRALNF